MMDPNTQNRKNASANRSDIAWKYGMEIENNPRKIMCNYCKKIISGGVYRFKQHLACTRKDVEACKSVPLEVNMEMNGVLTQLEKSSKRRMRNEEDEGMVESVSHKRGKMIIESILNTTIGNTQSILNQNSEKKLRDEVCQQIVKFFRTSGIPFSCAKNSEFVKIFELVEKCGSKFVPPSYHELENSFLENGMKNTTVMLEEYKYEWKKTGCSIICDEWTDMKEKFYCNFLVNSPAGTIFLKCIDSSNLFSETIGKVVEVLEEILEKVGEKNIVQVITNNTANYKAAAEMLIEGRGKIVWSPCFIQLLDGILEDFEKNLPQHRITIGKGKKIITFIYSRTIVISMLRDFTKGKDFNGLIITQSATVYLTLLYLFDMKDALIALFSSEQWKSNELAKTKEGEEIHQIVQDYGFWLEIDNCLIFALPIIEVLLKIFSYEQPTMRFIYKEMNSAKESLQSWNNINGYETIWKIFNERWNPLLHPQYIASHLLNPQVIYEYSTFKFPSESNERPSAWLAKMVIKYDDDLSMTAENLEKIEHQIVDFSTSKGLFGNQVAILMRNIIHPAEWWDSYGKHCPELQRMAIRLLSLTCSSCGSGQTWNAYEKVYPKKRNSLYQEKLNDLPLIIQNFKSKSQQARTETFARINPEVLPSDEDEDEDHEDVSEGVPLTGNHSGNEVDTCLYNSQPQSSASGVPLHGNHSGNEVDICLYNPQPQGSSSGIPLAGNHNGNEVDTCLYKPQPQSAASAGSHLYLDDRMPTMTEAYEMMATIRVPLPGNHDENEDTSWYIPQPQSVASGTLEPFKRTNLSAFYQWICDEQRKRNEIGHKQIYKRKSHV